MITPKASDRRCTVVIVGRPNVGKSTVFNKLLGKKKSLVLDTPGVTRDRIIGETEWVGPEGAVSIRLIDTGGIGGESFKDEIKRQVSVALETADIVLFVLDSQTGILPQDLEVQAWLRRSGIEEKTHVLTLINKMDDDSHDERLNDFYELGGQDTYPLSAEHSRGLLEIKEKILEIAASDKDIYDGVERPRLPRIVILGKPNVGKSTLLNAMIGQERSIVSPTAGTTSDPVDSEFQIGDLRAVLVDTAGIRRKSKTKQGVEVLSVVQTRKQLEGADLALLMLDGEEGASDQDEKISSLIEETGVSVLLLLNKWDLVKDRLSPKDAEKRVRAGMQHLDYAPFLLTSAKDGKGLRQIATQVKKILAARETKINSKELTEWLKRQLDFSNPHMAKLYYVHMAGNHPPTFLVHVNDPKKLHFSTRRQIINRIRGRWGFEGSPIRLKVKSSRSPK